jgi:hypothetical protein
VGPPKGFVVIIRSAHCAFCIVHIAVDMYLVLVLTLTPTNVSKAGQFENPWAIFYVETTIFNVLLIKSNMIGIIYVKMVSFSICHTQNRP